MYKVKPSRNRQEVLCFLTLIFLPCSYSSGKLSIQLLDYRNAGSQTYDGGCCDNIRYCVSSCDNFFVLCLAGVGVTDKCSLYRGVTQVTSSDSFSFSTSLGNGLRNPVIYGFTAWQPLKFSVEVWDDDSSNLIGKDSDLIDRYTLNIRHSPSPNKTNAHDYRHSLTGRQSTMKIKVEVYCDHFYFAPHCSTYCKSRDDSTGHYTCDYTLSRKVCREGWHGKDCLVHCRPRNDSGGHYMCNEMGQKLCLDGWMGENCTQENSSNSHPSSASSASTLLPTPSFTSRQQHSLIGITTQLPNPNKSRNFYNPETSWTKIQDLRTASHYSAISITSSFDNGPILPVSSSDNGSISPISSSVNGPILPVSSSDNGPILPVSSSVNGPILPVSSSDNGPILPISSSVNGPILPVSSSDNGPILPVSSSDNGPILPVSSSDNTAILPISSSDNGSILPISSFDNGTILPISSSVNGPILPISSFDNGTILPVSLSDNGPILPVSSSDNGPILPVSSSDNGPILPVLSSDNSHILPVSSFDNSPILPVSSSDNSHILPVSSSDNSPILPVSSSVSGPILPVSSSENDLVSPPSTSDIGSILSASLSDNYPMVSTSDNNPILPVSADNGPILPASSVSSSCNGPNWSTYIDRNTKLSSTATALTILPVSSTSTNHTWFATSTHSTRTTPPLGLTLVHSRLQAKVSSTVKTNDKTLSFVTSKESSCTPAPVGNSSVTLIPVFMEIERSENRENVIEKVKSLIMSKINKYCKREGQSCNIPTCWRNSNRIQLSRFTFNADGISWILCLFMVLFQTKQLILEMANKNVEEKSRDTLQLMAILPGENEDIVPADVLLEILNTAISDIEELCDVQVVRIWRESTTGRPAISGLLKNTSTSTSDGSKALTFIAVGACSVVVIIVVLGILCHRLRNIRMKRLKVNPLRDDDLTPPESPDITIADKTCLIRKQDLEDLKTSSQLNEELELTSTIPGSVTRYEHAS